MLRTRPGKEIIVKMANEIGAFDRLAKMIAEKGVNIVAVSAWVEGAQAIIHLVTDSDARVMDTLRALKYDAREADVLITKAPHKPGMLHRIFERLAQEGIDIHHLYATASITQEQTLVVLASANNDRAMVLMNAIPIAP